MTKKIIVHPDQIKVRGPKVDGGYTVVLELGEYEREMVAEIVKLPTTSQLKVTIELVAVS